MIYQRASTTKVVTNFLIPKVVHLHLLLYPIISTVGPNLEKSKGVKVQDSLVGQQEKVDYLLVQDDGLSLEPRFFRLNPYSL